MARAAWGLDIGYSSLKAVRVERVGSIAEITASDVIEIQPTDDEARRQELEMVAVSELLQRQRIGSEPVFVSVPNNKALFKPFSVGPVSAARFPIEVAHEAPNQIPFPINEVLWDFARLAPDADGNARAGLVAVRKEVIERLIADFRKVGLTMGGVQVGPLALYNLIRHEFGDENLLVLDAGARVTDFLVVDGEEFWFRPLPQSGQDYTAALEQKFRMTRDEAEALKMKMGDAKQSEKLLQIVEPLFRNQVADIQRTIGFYKSMRADWRLGRIVTTGNAFKLPGISEYLEKALGVEIIHFDSLERIRLGRGVDQGWWEDEVGGMGVALGLGLQGLELGAAKLSFLPEELIRSRAARNKQPIIAVAAAVALVASLAGFFGARHLREVARQDVEKLKRESERFSGVRREFEREIEAIPAMEAELDLLAFSPAGERGLALEAFEMLGDFRTADGQPAFGSKAAEHGMYLRHYSIRRDNPLTLGEGAGRSVDRAIVDWYNQLTRGGQQPLIALMEAELAGPQGTRNNTVNPDVRFIQSLRGISEKTSRVYEKNRSEPLIGHIIEPTEKDRDEGVLRMEVDGEELALKIDDIDSMVWLRSVTPGTDWSLTDNERISVSDSTVKELEKKRQRIPARRFVRFRIAWIVDDGASLLRPSSDADVVSGQSGRTASN